jgi:solute carrier family 6 GABA transporter-like protein 6/8/11/12/13
MIINSVLCMLYYNVIISWALFYFISSFRTELLWKKCGYWWNDERCFVPGSSNSAATVNDTLYNCTQEQFVNFTDYSCVPINATDRVTATEQFF